CFSLSHIFAPCDSTHATRFASERAHEAPPCDLNKWGYNRRGMKYFVALPLLAPWLFLTPMLAQGPHSNTGAVLIARALAHNRAALGATSAYTCLETVDRG